MKATSDHPAGCRDRTQLIVVFLAGKCYPLGVSCVRTVPWMGCALAVAMSTSNLAAVVDYADSRYAGQWLQHPVYGGPSFDAFVHSPQNPLLRGAAPFEWPVNSFFFADPVSRNWYIYVGSYPVGYAGRPCRCVLLRSADRGQSWTNLGVVLEGSKELFDQGGSTPDVSVVYAEGRYHMVYDWVEPDWSLLGGLGYAWADKPEGPFHRTPQPLTLNRDLTLLHGRYRRTYAATLLRRKHDWMILAMMDHAPNSWALFGMTAPEPSGPYSERILLRNVEADGFHPPLLEFYPAFVHRGFVYAPATSVALNRDYNILFRVPLECATEPAAWECFQEGSLWHSEDVENEAYGLWGQTFSGWVDSRGLLHASFHSRDPKGMGTVNVATRSWDQPLRKRGFVISGHQGPSLTLLERAFAGFRLHARLRLRGMARLLVDYDGVLGPNLPQSDATLHSLSLSRCDAVELSGRHWKVISFGEKAGQASQLGEGLIAGGPAKTLEAKGRRNHTPALPPETLEVTVDRKTSGATTLFVNDQAVWTGELPARRADGSSLLGIHVEAHSHLDVERFVLRGKPRPAMVNYLFSEAILGAGGSQNDWRELRGSEFRYGLASVAKASGARAKWNVRGCRFTLWSPRGPQFGRAELKVDGCVVTNLELHSEQTMPSAPVWQSPRLRDGPHAVVLNATDGPLVLDSIEVTHAR
jgi:hypothetical protein